MSGTVKMRYNKKRYVTVKTIGNQIIIQAPTYLAKVWAKKRLKEVSKEYGIELTEINGRFFVNHKQIAIMEEKMIPALQKCRK